MKKEIQIILAGSMILSACAPAAAQALEENGDRKDPATFVSNEVPPTVIALPTPYLLSILTEESTDTIEPAPIAQECVMPFEGAKWNTGHQFTSVIENMGNGVKTHHLGVDFKGAEGTPVVSVCDGTLMYAGEAFDGAGRNLGNIVVIKYDYFDNGVLQTVYGLYGHMKNIILGTPPGTVIRKGEFVGEVSYSGGWPSDHNHLHFQVIKERGRQDLEEFGKNNYGEFADRFWGYYPEEWPVGQIRRDFLDPKVFLTKLVGSN